MRGLGFSVGIERGISRWTSVSKLDEGDLRSGTGFWGLQARKGLEGLVYSKSQKLGNRIKDKSCWDSLYALLLRIEAMRFPTFWLVGVLVDSMRGAVRKLTRCTMVLKHLISLRV